MIRPWSVLRGRGACDRRLSVEPGNVVRSCVVRKRSADVDAFARNRPVRVVAGPLTAVTGRRRLRRCSEICYSRDASRRRSGEVKQRAARSEARRSVDRSEIDARSRRVLSLFFFKEGSAIRTIAVVAGECRAASYDM